MSDMLRSTGYLNNIKTLPNTNFDDLLKCVICYDKLIDPKMCPSCSKLCCKACIHRWLIENRSQCPHCRASLRLDQLVTCRFLKDITQALENITSVKNEDALDKCLMHNCPLNYYCVNCQNPICSDCAMFSTEHKGHEFQHLQNIYKKHVEQINTESKVLSTRVKDLEKILTDIDINIDKIRLAKEDKSRELIIYMDQVQSRLEAQLKEKFEILSLKREKAQEEIFSLKSLQTELDKELLYGAKSKLMAKSADLVKKLKAIKSLPLSNYETSSLSCEFQSEVIPKYEGGTFILNNYIDAQAKAEVVYSEALNSNGLIWRLKVYPNGNGIAKGSYLSVFIELLKGHRESAKYDYKVEMVHCIDHSQNFSREFSSEFETGECWGYNRFYRIDQLVTENFLNYDDSLCIKFYIRPPSYYQLYKDQKFYIKKLIEKENKSQEKILELMKKLEKYGEKTEEFRDDNDDECKGEDNELNLEEDKENEDARFKNSIQKSPGEIRNFINSNMSPEEISSDGEIVRKCLDWSEMQDIPDFHSCLDASPNDFLDSSENDENDLYL
ncbi:hypothetical protein SteCoe_18456 [Stentor coeruleus]|uniref:RING-type domain-containing protein n=1 Tax=Stentor coeruleus TaxID=5963 RepID=A0A1R2BWR3_9CILI|nr:hypothetical protein SteCoe_18456 [Stentor coeruleus]